jgi:hypothetical protein
VVAIAHRVLGSKAAVRAASLKSQVTPVDQIPRTDARIQATEASACPEAREQLSAWKRGLGRALVRPGEAFDSDATGVVSIIHDSDASKNYLCIEIPQKQQTYIVIVNPRAGGRLACSRRRAPARSLNISLVL